jgi:hypothetical protein
VSYELLFEPVESSNVAGARYLDDESTLELLFRDGSVYAYSCGREVYEALLKAPSKGRFVWQELRDRYPYRCVSKGSTSRARSGRRAG